MKRVFIFLYGADLSTFLALKPKAEEPIICADSGIELAMILPFQPKDVTLIGDLDSVSKKALSWCKKNSHLIIQQPQEKDFTDGHLAIAYACECYGKAIEKIILGGITQQLDHTLGNILPAVPLINGGHKLIFLKKSQKIYLVNTSLNIKNCMSHTISLIPLPIAVIKNTKGLQWKTKNETIDSYQSRTLRNKAINDEVEITMSSGTLMVVESWEN